MFHIISLDMAENIPDNDYMNTYQSLSEYLMPETFQNHNLAVFKNFAPAVPVKESRQAVLSGRINLHLSCHFQDLPTTPIFDKKVFLLSLFFCHSFSVNALNSKPIFFPELFFKKSFRILSVLLPLSRRFLLQKSLFCILVPTRCYVLRTPFLLNQISILTILPKTSRKGLPATICGSEICETNVFRTTIHCCFSYGLIS